ncbi:MAG TPA: hypothetical protein VGT44_11635, partial [Ktedonobacteraceae bacterium]|nr:hypothetical protein [Ktedonobacteraceae bacterium]
MNDHQWNQPILWDEPDQAIDEWDSSTDMLGVLATTRRVVEVSELAWVNHDCLAAVASQLRDFKQQEGSQ